MVAESLKARFERKLTTESTEKEKANSSSVQSVVKNSSSSAVRKKLDQLFTYDEKPHQFPDSKVTILIATIDDALKILDLACGSGAFPMSVLHKLVYYA